MVSNQREPRNQIPKCFVKQKRGRYAIDDGRGDTIFYSYVSIVNVRPLPAFFIRIVVNHSCLAVRISAWGSGGFLLMGGVWVRQIVECFSSGVSRTASVRDQGFESVFEDKTTPRLLNDLTTGMKKARQIRRAIEIKIVWVYVLSVLFFPHIDVGGSQYKLTYCVIFREQIVICGVWYVSSIAYEIFSCECVEHCE